MIKRLRDLPGYEIASGDPDIRGWKVLEPKGTQTIGTVDSLLIDTDRSEVRYVSVKVGDTTRLVPIGQIDLDEDQHQVSVQPGALGTLDRLPVYQGEEITPEREQQLYATFIPQQKTTAYRRPEFEPKSERIQLVEERLRVGKREEKLGEAVARKKVTEHPVQETTQLRREHVEIERHPVNKPLSETRYAQTGGKIFESDQEIRMPIMGERAVVEKEPFIKEEVVLRKTFLTEPETVRAKVREEEVEFAGTEPEKARGRENKGLGERLKDAVNPD